MTLSQELLDTSDCTATLAPSFDALAHHIPMELLQASLSLSSHATIRRRRLPGDMVLWLVIGMASFRLAHTPMRLKEMRGLYCEYVY